MERLSRRLRGAQVLALEGVERTRRGAVRMRELRQSDGVKELSEAAGVLQNAAAMMAEIKLPPPERHLDIKAFSNPDQGILNAAAQRLGKSPPTSLWGLYVLFSFSTTHLAETLEAQAEKRNETIFPGIVQEITLYLRLGDVVARTARRLS